jgi:hypothetical protein
MECSQGQKHEEGVGEDGTSWTVSDEGLERGAWEPLASLEEVTQQRGKAPEYTHTHTHTHHGKHRKP